MNRHPGPSPIRSDGCPPFARLLPLAIAVSLFVLLGLTVPAVAETVLSPDEIRSRLEAKIEGYLHDPTWVELGRTNGYFRDGLELLRQYHTLATPKLVHVDGKPVKYLVPVVFDDSTLAGFIHVDPFDADVLGWPSWDARGRPLYQVSRQEWEGESSVASWSQGITEMIPTSLLVSPGLRVNPYAEPGWHVIDHGLDEMPSKDQEDRKEWIEEINRVHQPRPRWSSFGNRWRQPALKCLSFAATTCGDWWTLEYGRALGSYTNVVNGAREYGHNPRAIESVFYVRHRLDPLTYFTVPVVYPDPVTHEPIPFSLPGYVDALIRPMRGTLPDPALPSAFVYELPSNLYSMEKSAVTLFRFMKGKAATVKTALARHGIVYAQVDSGIPVIGFLTGIHAVAIVGWKDVATGTVFLYRESFGNFAADYQEDMAGGPKYRACGVESFNQAYAFPHSLGAELVRRDGSDAVLAVANKGGVAIDADLPGARAFLLPSGPECPVTRGAGKGRLVVKLPDGTGSAARLRLVLPRRFYYQADGRPAEVTVPLSGPRPQLDPYDLAMQRLVQTALDRLEAFVGALEIRKSSYAFYSLFARYRLSRQLSRVLKHRQEFDQVWEAFAANPVPAMRRKLIDMMRRGFADYSKQLAEYEKELVDRLNREKDAIRKERFRVELMEVRQFLAGLQEMGARLETVVAVLPPHLLDGKAAPAAGRVPTTPAASSGPAEAPTTDTAANDPAAVEETDEKASDSAGSNSDATDFAPTAETGALAANPTVLRETGSARRPTAASAQAFLEYQAAYRAYEKTLTGKDSEAAKAALLKYREAYDRYRATMAVAP